MTTYNEAVRAAVYSTISHAAMSPRHADRFKNLTPEQFDMLDERLKAVEKRELLKWIEEDNATRAPDLLMALHLRDLSSEDFAEYVAARAAAPGQAGA